MNQQELVKSMGLVVLEPSNQPRFLGTSSGVTLAKIVMASMQCHILPTPPSPTVELGSEPVYSRQSSLPPRRAAAQIIDAYFEYRTPHYPIVDRTEVGMAIEQAYGRARSTLVHDGEMDQSLFICFMVFGIGLCGMLNAAGERPPESEGCFNSALQYLDTVLSYSKSDLDTLRTILLLAQYISLMPSRGSLWRLTGHALRVAIDIGLHWETDAILGLDPTLLNRRRRLFWAAYQFDRLLAITLGRPFGVVDPSTSVGFPNPYEERHPIAAADVHFQKIANHVAALAKLESEIKHVLYHQLRENSIAYPRPNYSIWLQSIQPRLQEWQATVPAPTSSSPRSIYSCDSWWSAVYNNALLLLHRPNPLVPQPSVESLRICFESSTRLIRDVKALQREHRIDILWVWTHRLFIAGLTLMYSIWNSEEIKAAYPVDEIVNTIHCGASTLSAITERFPGANGCRDAFETLASATMKRLLSPQNPVTLGPDLETLQHNFPSAPWTQNLQPENSIEDVFSMLSNETFSFSEMLGSNAQWAAEFVGLDQDISFEW